MKKKILKPKQDSLTEKSNDQKGKQRINDDKKRQNR